LRTRTLMGTDDWDDYQTCLSEARTPMGQHATGYLRALAECPDEAPVRIVAYDGRDQPVGGLASVLYTGGPVPLIDSLPYGYGGVFSRLSGEERAACAQALCDELLLFAQRVGARLVTIQTPPFPDGPALYRRVFQPDHELRSWAQYVDLQAVFEPVDGTKQGDLSTYPAVIRRNHRRNLKRAEDAGIKVGQRNSPDAVDCYCDIQERRMGELGGRPRPREFYQGILKHMCPEGTGWFFRAQDDGQLVSGTPLIGVRDVLDVVLICMDSRAVAKQPNAALCYRSMEWAFERGFRLYNFQSGVSRGDDLYRWKAGWRAEEAAVSIMTRITGDIAPIVNMPRADMRAAYGIHYVLPYPVIDAARNGRPTDVPELRVIEKGD